MIFDYLVQATAEAAGADPSGGWTNHWYFRLTSE
jgi:hypothetical protein